MQIKDYLKTYQPTLFKTFSNAKRDDSLSHAYLLVGQKGTPLYQSALYLAKSLVCDHPHPLACDRCLTCERIAHGNYADLFIVDGEKESIKKDSVLEIEKYFSVTSSEKKGVLIYIIHLIENMTAEATNALLKFLEEPHSNVYAFLTTENETNVLPTIISRAQSLKLKLIPRDTLLALCAPLGIDKEDVELLTALYNEPSIIEEESEKEDYHIIKDKLLSVLNALSESLKEGYLEASLTLGTMKERYLVKTLLHFLALFFKDSLNYTLGMALFFPSFTPLLEKLSKKIKNPLSLVIKTYEVSDKLNSNVNISLLIDELFINILKEHSYE